MDNFINVKANLENLGIFRKATETDIKKDNVVFLIGDDNIMWKLVIDETYNLYSAKTSFCAKDGCVYGLSNMWILKNNTELISKIQKLETIIENISKLIDKEKQNNQE